MIEIKCTDSEQTLLKRSIRRCNCSNLCEYKPYCNKPPNMTCGEYVVGMIKWDIMDEPTHQLNQSSTGSESK